jgi:uncharacterized protein (DUF983 family)
MVERSTQTAMINGLQLKCPACGEGQLFKSFLKVTDTCPTCGEELHHQRADDAPAYFTMFIVGHIVVGLVMVVESAYAPELWVHALLWGPLLVGLSLFLLPRIKGALIGLQWAQRMHGFDDKGREARATDALDRRPVKISTHAPTP